MQSVPEMSYTVRHSVSLPRIRQQPPYLATRVATGLVDQRERIDVKPNRVHVWARPLNTRGIDPGPGESTWWLRSRQ